jgi:hypothetical protein
VVHLEHAESRLPRRGLEQGDSQVRLTREHEHRSRFAVQVLRLDRPSETGRHPDLDEWQGLLHRQHLNRTSQVILKYEFVYLHAWKTGAQAWVGIGRKIAFYNHQRSHTAHGGQLAAEVYVNAIETDRQVQALA